MENYSFSFDDISFTHCDVSPWNKGLNWQFSEEHIENMRKPKSQEHKQNMRKPKSESHKQNIKANHAKPWLGRKRSPETRAKIAATMKAKFASKSVD